MDPNEADIAWVLELQSVAPLDSKSWREDGFVLQDALSPELTELLQQMDVNFQEVLHDGKWIIRSNEWLTVYDLAFRKLHALMCARSPALSATGPSVADLKDAPLLTKWLTVRDKSDQNAALLGLVEKHPLLGKRWIRTSRLCGIDPNQNWARTCSRWYSLQDPISPDEMVKILGNKASGVLEAALPLREAISRTIRDQGKAGFQNENLQD